MDIEEFIERLKQMDGVEFKRDETMLMHRIVDFLLEDYNSYSKGRVATSSVAVDTDDETVLTEGTIHYPVEIETYAIEKAGATESIHPDVNISVMDNVLHIYFSEGCSVETCFSIVKVVSEGGKDDVVSRLTERSF